MRDRRENDASDEDNRQATVKCIQTCKELATRGGRYMDGAHSTQEHCRVKECINPAQALKDVIPGHTDEQRSGDKRECDDPAVGQPDNETFRRNYGLSAMLKLWEQPFHCAPNVKQLA